MTFNSGLKLFSATQAELLPEPSGGQTEHQALLSSPSKLIRSSFWCHQGGRAQVRTLSCRVRPAPSRVALHSLSHGVPLRVELRERDWIPRHGRDRLWPGSDPALVLSDFQNFLRTQMGNTTTVNIIISTVDYLLRLQVSGPWVVACLRCTSKS